MLTSVPSSSSVTTSLPQSEILEIVTMLDNLLQTMPAGSLPLSTNGESAYKKLLTFHPLPSDWLDNIGEVGAVNRQLEVIFGTRAFGFQLRERGSYVEMVVPILRFYLERFPGDIILQKWLLDLYHAAYSAHVKAGGDGGVSNMATSIDLTGDASEAEELPSPSQLVVRSKDAKRRRSSGTGAGGDELEPSNQAPANKPKDTQKRRKAHKRRKGSLPAEDNINTLPQEVDSRWKDILEETTDRSKGGALPDPLARQLTRSCHAAPGVLGVEGTYYRCIASSICHSWAKGEKRHLDRIYKHAVRCDALKRWKPELHAQAEKSLATLRSMPAKAAQNPVLLPKGETDTSGSPADRLPAFPPTKVDPFAPFRAQGKLDLKSRIDLAVVRLICASGMAPRIVDSTEWKDLISALQSPIRPRSRYEPPSASTLRDKLIPAESALVTINTRELLRNQQNITISFDGLTKGSQSLYTFHAITAGRLVFLYKGDVFQGSHNSDYIETVLTEIITEVGVDRIAAVVSDNTNTTKKSRREITKTHPSILNIPDPIHALHLVAKDLGQDEEWQLMLEPMCELLTFFGHSTHASSRLQECQDALHITTALISIGPTRFGSTYISAQSVSTNLPAIQMAYRKGMFSSIPQSLEEIFDETTIAATQFRMSLIKFTRVLEPIHRALTCLEATDSTLGDVFAYWLAAVASLDKVFSDESTNIPKPTVQRFKSRVYARFLDAIENAPSDAFVAGHVLHPAYRHAEIYQHMRTMSSKIYIRLPAPNPSSPAKHVPDAIYKRVRKFTLLVLYQLLKVSENKKDHVLYNYDAARAKTECEAQLAEYVRGNYPFHRPLGMSEAPAEYWRSLKHMPEAFILAVVGEKVNSILPNSMCDERTGSRITFLNSDLRSCTDVKTMVEQIKVKQYYSMQDGKVQPKRRTPTHFRSFVQSSTTKAAASKTSCVAEDPRGDHDELFSAGLQADSPLPELSSVEMNELTAKFNSALQFYDLSSPALLNTLSDQPISTPPNSSLPKEKGKGKSTAPITAADDISWD